MNEPIWAIEYSREARNYIYDSYPYTEAILIEIERLRFAEDAIPSEGGVILEPGVDMCVMLNHIVIYQRLPDTQPKPTLWIGIVKPQG